MLRRRLLRAPLSSLALKTSLAVGALVTPAVLSATGCSSSPSACTAEFSGDITESGTLASGCGAVTQDVDGGTSDSVLKLSASSAHIAALEISISLGDTPATGTLSSETVTDWKATGLGGDGGACGYVAGAEGVPTGSFTLTITSVAGDATNRVVHGTLDMTLYVHAPPGTDCGPGESETVHLTF